MTEDAKHSEMSIQKRGSN